MVHAGTHHSGHAVTAATVHLFQLLVLLFSQHGFDLVVGFDPTLDHLTS